MKLDSEALKKSYVNQVDALSREIATGYQTLDAQTKQLEALRDQLRRIEGAKIMAERVLNDVVAAEKAAAAKDTNENTTGEEVHRPVAARK